MPDLTDYCIMQNWFDPSKDTDAAKWTKPDKAMAWLRAALSPAARAVYKYSLGLPEDDQKKPHMVLSALREYFGTSIGFSGEQRSVLAALQTVATNVWLSERKEAQEELRVYWNFRDELSVYDDVLY